MKKKNDLNSTQILPSTENPDIITLNILVYMLPDSLCTFIPIQVRYKSYHIICTV